MDILITGGSGFIGNAMALHMAKAGHRVVALARRPLDLWPIAQHPSLQRLQVDLKDEAGLTRVFGRLKPHTVIHTAWEGMTRDKRDNPAQAQNLLATQNVMQAAGAHGCKIFIGLGSQAEYGVHNRRISEEDAVPAPASLYGCYKLAAGHAGMHFAAMHDFNYAWLRLFSAFGPGDGEDYIIPHTIKNFLAGTLPKLSNCQQQWDYLYVNDICRLVELVLAKKEDFRGMYNLCSGQPRRLKDIVFKLKEISGNGVDPYFDEQPPAPGSLLHLEGDTAKFQKTFGWVELSDFDQSLKETVQWFQQTQAIKK